MTQTLHRQLRVSDVVVLGLGAMLGAGVFTGLAPAASTAGWWLLGSLPLAAMAAICSAFSTADQWRAYRGSGNGHRYAREQLGLWPGRMTGNAYVAGHAAGAAAVAGAFGVYVLPDHSQLAALGAISLAAGLAGVGSRWGTVVSWLLTVVVLLVLGLVVVVCFSVQPPLGPAALPRGVPGSNDSRGLLLAASTVFFAFLGFERITMPAAGDAVPESRRLRLAIPIVVVLALAVYLAVGAAVLHQLGPARLALSTVPLRDALYAADAAALLPVITVGAVAALLPVLLMVLGGMRRTVSSMADRGDLPRVLAGVDQSGRPLRATMLSGGLAAFATLLFTPAHAVGLAAGFLLFHYAFTNASARVLHRENRTWPMRTACLGVGLSVLLGMCVPAVDLLIIFLVMFVGSALAAVRSRRGR